MSHVVEGISVFPGNTSEIGGAMTSVHWGSRAERGQRIKVDRSWTYLPRSKQDRKSRPGEE